MIKAKTPTHANAKAKHDAPNGLVYAMGDHIYFYDEVTTESVLEFNTLLSRVAMQAGTGTMNSMHEYTQPAPIWIHLNTPGGLVIDGLNMYDNIARISKTAVPVAIIVEGQASSMGAILAQAGTQRYMRENSFMLIHQIRGGHWGTMAKLEDDFANSKLLYQKLKDILKEKTKIPAPVLADLLKSDLYLDAKKCKRYGMIDEII